MTYKMPEDKWDADGLRERLFGKEKQGIEARYSSEFVREYSSSDADSNFVLKKSHHTLTLSSERKFAYLGFKEIEGICDRVYAGKKDGIYEVVYHFNNIPDEFFIVNNMLSEIAEMNRDARVNPNYNPAQNSPETTKKGRALSDVLSKVDFENIYYHRNPVKGRINLTILSKKPFKFPERIDGYDIGVRQKHVEINQDLFGLTYSLPKESARILEERIINEIAQTN